MTKIKRSMGNLLVSIVELLVGVLLFINPAGVTVGVIIAAGVILILNGIYQIARCFLIEPEEAAQERNLFKGLCAILLGLFCAFDSRWFIDTFPALTVIYGIASLVTGIRKLQWAVDMIRQEQRYWLAEMLGAVLTLVLAVLILCVPFRSVDVQWYFVSVSLIVAAAVDALNFVLGNI